MAGNAAPIYSRVGDIQWGASIATANTALDGTGTTSTLFTADATNGGRVERIRGMHAGTNISSVVRFFINNGSSSATAANNWLLADATMAANTLSQLLASSPAFDIPGIPFPLVLPPGYKILACVGTTIAAGVIPGAVGGKY